LFGGSGGMFDTPERERKIRQVDLFDRPQRFDPMTGEAIARPFDTVQHQRNSVKKNKRLVDIFESDKRLTDYEKADRLKNVKEENMAFKEHLKADMFTEKEKFGKILKGDISQLKTLEIRETELKQKEKNKTITTKEMVELTDIGKQIGAKEQDIYEGKYVISGLKETYTRRYNWDKDKIPVGHDPLSLFSKPKGSTSVSEEMKRLRGLQKRKPKKLVYSYDLKTRDTFDLIGSPKQRREIPYNTRPMGVSNPVSTIREPVNQLSRLTSQKIIDPFGGISVKKTKPSRAKKPIVVNVFGSLTASKRKKEPPLKKLFGGGFDLAPIKVKKAKPLKTSKKKRNVNDAFNLFGKPKKGGLF
jgi:hypothetical protein